jgi:hypothetical protein
LAIYDFGIHDSYNGFFYVYISGVIERNTSMNIYYDLIFLKPFLYEVIYDYVNAILTSILPFMILHYFLILYKDKYKKYLNQDKVKEMFYLKWYYIVFYTPILLYLLSLVIWPNNGKV